MKLLAIAAIVLFPLALPAADDKKADPPVTLKLIAKTDTYTFDSGGKTSAEFKKQLADVVSAQKVGRTAQPPKPLAIDLVLQFTNTTDKEVTIYVGGDPNTWAFELTGGDGVVTADSGLAFTREFRLPKAIALAPGKSHEIPVKRLADGARGAARNVYWTGPGEYKLTAKYTLADEKGGKGAVLTSEPVKITVTEK